MSNEIKRVKYFDGLLLKAEDLILEQNYHMQMRRIHNRYFHDWGIVTGLIVKPIGLGDNVQEKLNSPIVSVTPGLAINRVIDQNTNEEFGQEIWICENHIDNPLDLSIYSPADEIYITVCYEEADADVDIKKGGHETRIWERARIKHSASKPKDEKREIILARVKLISDSTGNKSIYNIYDTDLDGSLLRTYAVLNGDAAEVSKLSFGAKNGPHLPFINGIKDATMGDGDGIEIHSPFTSFTGGVYSGPLTTKGNVDVNGAVTVHGSNKETFKVSASGNIEASGSVSIAGPLAVAGGINVSGGSVNMDTTQFVVTGNMITMNKKPQDNQGSTEKPSSGIDVYRGDSNPDAKLVWDERDKVWKAGIEARSDVPESGMYAIAYGDTWENMHNGSNADNMHKHSKLYSDKGQELLNIEANGDVLVEKSLISNGNLVTKTGIFEAFRGNSLSSAMILWDETTERWKVGIKDKMVDIPYGDKWDELTDGKHNADELHKHSQFYNKDNLLAIGINKDDGNVDIPVNLRVGKDLTIAGKLNVIGGVTTVSNQVLEIKDNFITVNKYDGDAPLVNESGIQVYRGGKDPDALILWDEAVDSWKIGTKNGVFDIPYGVKWNDLTDGTVLKDHHKHTKLYASDGTEKITVNDKGNLDIATDANISGAMNVVGDAKVEGALNVDGPVTLKGDLLVKGTTTTVKSETLTVKNKTIFVNSGTDANTPLTGQSGLEVCRGDDKSAKMVWDEEAQKWKLGLTGNLYNVAYGPEWDTLTGKALSDDLHKHSNLYDGEGNNVLKVNGTGATRNIEVDEDTTINGTLTVSEDMTVKDKLTVKGDLVVDGKATIIKKVNMEVTDNVILLNKYEETESAPDADDEKNGIKESGIEIYRGNQPKARIVWDEAQKKWRMGTGDDLEDIAQGGEAGKVAQLYNSNGDILAISVNPTGDVDIHRQTTVGEDLSVLGNFTVSGDSTAIDSKEVEVKSGTILINKYGQKDTPTIDDSGILVYRGEKIDSAKIVWNEADRKWKIGTSSDKPALSVNDTGDINAAGGIECAGTIKANGADIKGSLLVDTGIEVIRNPESKAQIVWDKDGNKWKIGTAIKTGISVTQSGEVGIGTENPTEKLEVSGNGIIKGSFETTGSATIGGVLTANGSAVVNGKLQADSLTVNNNMTVVGALNITEGLTVDRGATQPKAKITWSKEKNKWLFGLENNLQELILNSHEHHTLCNESETITAVSVDNSGKVGIGNSNPKAALDVQGDTVVSGALNADSIAVSKDLVIGGNLTVRGDVVTINSSNLDVKDNIIKINNYAPQDVPININAGLEVFRGGKEPNAQIIWDENAKAWKLGLNNNLRELCYGDHKHNKLFNAAGSIEVITVADNGDVTLGATTSRFGVKGTTVIDGKLTAANAEIRGTTSISGALTAGDIIASGNVGITGSLALSRGIEVTRQTGGNAKLSWDETSGKWKAGIGDALTEIASVNHNHSELYLPNGSVKAISVSTTGDITVGSNATNLNVNGTTVFGGKVTASSAEVNGLTTISGDLTASNITASGNVGISGSLTLSNGIEVTRSTGGNAKLVWDEKSGKWKSGIGDTLTEISLSNHNHSGLYTPNGSLQAISVSTSGDVSIGSSTSNLIVRGTAALNGKLTAGSADLGATTISGRLTTGEIAATGNVGINGSLTLSKGIEVTRTTGDKAKLSWDDTSGKWKAGTGDTLLEIAYKGHKHNGLYTSDESILALTVLDNGDLSIGNSTSNLFVKGSASFDSNLTVASAEIKGAASIGDKMTSGSAEIKANAAIGGKLTAGEAEITGKLTLASGIEVSRGTNPAAKLYFDNTAGKWETGIGDTVTAISLEGHKHNSLYTSDLVTEAIKVDASGNVGVGRESTTEHKMAVNGSILATKFAETSSRTFKENIKNLTVKSATDLLNKLNPVFFDFKADCSKKHNIGFIAEEVPDIFTTSDKKSVSMMDIIAVLTTVVKKQQKESNTLKKQLVELQKQVAILTGI